MDSVQQNSNEAKIILDKHGDNGNRTILLPRVDISPFLKKKKAIVERFLLLRTFLGLAGCLSDAEKRESSWEEPGQ